MGPALTPTTIASITGGNIPATPPRHRTKRVLLIAVSCLKLDQTEPTGRSAPRSLCKSRFAEPNG